MNITDFLLARITEDEASGHAEVRWRAECAAKRQIVEWHQNWPVFVEKPPVLELDQPEDGWALGSVNAMTARWTAEYRWTTEQEYRRLFGDEPPTAPILRMLAAVYADHPDYDPEWAI